ncbi:MAG TPA: exosortase/archaeosortase family protein [Phycisphaerae bacterium]|nr:exosortase/archaeosortase family protein [Phycisphaerae bacterium]
MSSEANNTAVGASVRSAALPRRFEYASAGAIGVPVADKIPRGAWLGLAAVFVGMVAAYHVELVNLVTQWATDEGWSHGFVVPVLAGVFAWWRRDLLLKLRPKGTVLGLVLVLMGVVGHVLFRAGGVVHMSYLSMMVVLYGVVLWALGWDYLKILWMPISYLVFAMVPPSTLYVKATTPLQTVAAELSVRMMPLFGGEAFRMGTTIKVHHGGGWAMLNVEDACSGMRMLVAFFALAVALAYTTSRPMWQKVTLAAAALPIAILCNALRVTLTGVIGTSYGMQYTKGTPHALLGLAMLIPALGLQLGVAWVLDKMFVEVPSAAGVRR